MEHRLIKRRKWFTAVLLAICTALCFGAVAGATGSDPDPDEAEAVEADLYAVSTALSAYANRILGANRNEKHQHEDALSELEFGSNIVGNGGIYLGYGDKKRGFVSSVSGDDSQTTKISYRAWIGKNTGRSTSYGYMRYGRLLNDLGLDETAPGSQNVSFMRSLTYVTYILYTFSAAIIYVFYLAFDGLRLLNPFSLFRGSSFINGDMKTLLPDYAANVDMSKYGVGGLASVRTGIKTIAEKWFVPLYDSFAGAGLYVVLPFLLAILIASIFLFRRRNYNDTFRRVAMHFVRLAFIIMAIPIFGSCYTTVLDFAATAFSDQNSPATKLIASTFVDFGTWVDVARLGAPAGVTLVSHGSSVDASASGEGSDKSWSELRYTIAKLNTINGITTGMTATKDEDSLYQNAWNISTLSGRDDTMSSDVKANVGNMLNEYAKGTRYEASSFASAVNARMNGSGFNRGYNSGTEGAESNANTVFNMFDLSNEVDDWMNRESSENKKFVRSGNVTQDTKSYSFGFTIFGNGLLRASGGPEGNGLSTSTSAASGDITYTAGHPGTHSKQAANPKKSMGLSTLSMYNYLCSEFTDTDVIVYSNSDATSDAAKNSHYTVTCAGSGAMRWLYWISCNAIIGIMAVLAVMYIFGMVIRVVKNSVKMITAIPMAMLGVMKSIMQVCTCVVTMIVELLATALLYNVILQLLVVFSNLIDTISHGIADDMVNGTATVCVGGLLGSVGVTADASFLLNTKAFVGLTLILGTVLAVIFAYAALKVRKRFLYGFEVAVEKFGQFSYLYGVIAPLKEREFGKIHIPEIPVGEEETVCLTA